MNSDECLVTSAVMSAVASAEWLAQRNDHQRRDSSRQLAACDDSARALANQVLHCMEKTRHRLFPTLTYR